MRENNHHMRLIARAGIYDLICGKSPDLMSLVKLMSIVSKGYNHYGLANEVDFRELTPLFERLFAFNNKHFYIYKAISNPNKIGSLSCKQYRKLEHLKKLWINRDGEAGNSLHCKVDEFLEKNGTMASPYKLLKRAFKDNAENTKFLSRFFPLEEDGKTTKNESYLIQLCDAMMQLNTAVEIKDATIQECYNLDFHGSNINGSGERHCANSCMYGKPVGAFYDAFGAHGKMVYYKGRPVGRFLLWDLPEGCGKKGYVDRLYVRGEYINEVLAEIDKQFSNEDYLKYPYLRINTHIPVVMPIKDVDSLLSNPQTPYIDTFAYLYKDYTNNRYVLSNSDSLEGFRFLGTIRSTHSTNKLKACPHCKKAYWTGDSEERGVTTTAHKLYCTGYQPRTRQLKEYITIFRNSLNELGGANGQEPEFIF